MTVSRTARVIVACALLAWAFWSTALARDDLPAPQGRVSDFAHVIGDVDRARMERAILGLEERTGAQIGVVTVRSLGGVPIEDFAVRVFEKWGVGHQGRDDGVLVMLAVDEGAVRIEVGYGLEGALPDGVCGEINRETMIPRFRQGDFAGGLADGVERIAEIVAEKQPPTGAAGPARARSNRSWWVWLAALVVVMLVIAVAWRLARR